MDCTGGTSRWVAMQEVSGAAWTAALVVTVMAGETWVPVEVAGGREDWELKCQYLGAEVCVATDAMDQFWSFTSWAVVTLKWLVT